MATDSVRRSHGPSPTLGSCPCRVDRTRSEGSVGAGRAGQVPVSASRRSSAWRSSSSSRRAVSRLPPSSSASVASPRRALSVPKTSSMALTCGYASVAKVGKDRRHGVQTPLPDLLSAHRLACTAGPQAGVQERRDPRVTARGGGLAPTGRPATTLLAGPGRALGVDAAALQTAPTPSIRDPADVAALASGPGQTPLDQAPTAHPIDRRRRRSYVA